MAHTNADTVKIGCAHHADEVLGRDIRSDEGRPDDIPGQASTGEEVVGACRNTLSSDKKTDPDKYYEIRYKDG